MGLKSLHGLLSARLGAGQRDAHRPVRTPGRRCRSWFQ
jgi:hypothetical protein